MTSAFFWQNCQPFPCFILYSKVKLACCSWLGSIPINILRVLLYIPMSMNINRIVVFLNFTYVELYVPFPILHWSCLFGNVSENFPCNSNSFFSAVAQYSISHCLFHLVLIYGHLGYCAFFTVSNSARKNIFVQFSLATSMVISLGLKVIPGCLINVLCTFSAFLGIIIIFLQVNCTNFFSHKQYINSLFPQTFQLLVLSTFVLFFSIS